VENSGICRSLFDRNLFYQALMQSKPWLGILLRFYFHFGYLAILLAVRYDYKASEMYKDIVSIGVILLL
jgi:hypothetical protein